MTLSEIETILPELALRHPDLNEQLLTTLLTSAGWEDKNIKEAVLLFKQGDFKKTSVAPVVSQVVQIPETPAPNESEVMAAPLTYYQQDGKEESLRVLTSEEVVDVKKREEPIILPKEPIKEEMVTQSLPEENKNTEPISLAQSKALMEEHPPILTPGQKVAHDIQERDFIVKDTFTEPRPTTYEEPQSLIVHDEKLVSEKITKEHEIPANLPLIPFESSPHVWSFSRYKDTFHAEEQQKVTPPVSQIVEKPVISSVPVQPAVTHVSATPEPTGAEVVDDISLEKTPMTKGDESLVLLASFMLLAIILILGYMYGNGRL